MAKVKRLSPRLEILEDRAVPATVRFDGSNLFISNAHIVNNQTNLAVTQQASGAFQVTDNGANNGTYRVTGNITITGTNAADKIAVTLDKGAGGMSSLPGSLNVNTANGNDSVTLTTTGNGGTVRGNLSVNFGRGADFLGVDPAGAGAPNLAIRGLVQVTGQAGSAQLPPGSPAGVPAHNYVEFGQNTTAGQTTFVGGNVTIQGIDDIKFGVSNTNGGQTFAGDVNIQQSANAPAFFDGGVSLGPNYNNYVTMSVSSKFLGNVTVQATSGDNYVLADANVGGSLTANLGPGGVTGNVLELNFNVPAGTAGAAPMTVGKDVNYTAGDANNTLIIDDNGPAEPLNVGGSFNVNFGSGDNTYTFFNTPQDFTVSGSVSFRAGNGSNNIPFVGTVTIDELFNLGSGNNSVTLTSAPGGTVTFRGGNGTDALKLDNGTATAQNYLLDAVFGNGTNTFTIADSSGAGNTISGRAIGGTGSNTFVQQDDAQLAPTFDLENFS